MRLSPVDSREAAGSALDVYLSNPGYFSLIGNPSPTLQDIESDRAALPPDAVPGQKLYRLIDGGDGLIDLIGDYPKPGEAFIGLFMVHGRLHRQGRGRAWMQEIEEMLRETGCRRLRLSVIEENRGALAFWKSLGFEESGRCSAHLPSGELPAVRMEKIL